MIDRIAGAEGGAAKQISQSQNQRPERSDEAAEAVRFGGAAAVAADGIQAPTAAEATRVAEIAALRDEALATAKTATEAQLAATAQGREVPVGRGLDETVPPEGEAETDTAAETERRQVEAEDLARRIRDDGDGAPHGGGAKVDLAAVRALLGE